MKHHAYQWPRIAEMRGSKSGRRNGTFIESIWARGFDVMS